MDFAIAVDLPDSSTMRQIQEMYRSYRCELAG